MHNLFNGRGLIDYDPIYPNPSNGDGNEPGALDLITGTVGKDVIFGLGGSDALSGGDGDDYIEFNDWRVAA